MSIAPRSARTTAAAMMAPALIAVLFAALTSYGALANNLKGTPRHACHGNACGQGTTLPHAAAAN